jgi:ligand-binding sensor domain-containing protein
MKVVLLFLWLTMFPGLGIGQTSTHITTDNGLRTNMMSVIMQDRDHYMWMGSYDGLHKHEGSRIKTYLQRDKPNAISSDETHSLLQDKQGFIWAGTTGGLDKIDPVTGVIVHYPLRPPDTTSAFIGYIYSIFQDAEDAIWVSTDAALFRLDYKTGNSNAIPNSKSGEGVPEHITGFKSGVSTNKGVWMYTPAGVIFYEYKRKQFFHRYHNPHKLPVFNAGSLVDYMGANTDMVLSANQYLYFITGHKQLTRYHLETEKIDSFLFDRPQNAWTCCYSLAVDHRNNVWMGFRHGGILLFDAERNDFTPITYKDQNSLISSNYISSIAEDYTGQMWVTSDKGLNIIDYYKNDVQKIQLSAASDFVDLKHAAGNISKSGTGDLFIPFSNGSLIRVNAANLLATHMQPMDTAIKIVSYVYEDEKWGLLFAANRTMYKLKLNSAGFQLQALEVPYVRALNMKSGSVVWMHKVSETSIYFKKSNGQMYYFNGSDSLESFPCYGFKQLACISADQENLYYIDDHLDLVSRNLQTRKSIKIYLQEKVNQINFQFSVPRNIADDGLGNIWITSQNGMLRYHLPTDKLYAYTTQHGLSHSFTFSVSADSKGRVWVGSLGGVDWYNAANDKFQNVVSYSSGTYMDAFGSSLVTKNDQLFFVAGNHLFRIDADSFLSRKQSVQHLKINKLMLNGKPLNWKEKGALDNLPYTSNRIEIHFSLLAFTGHTAVRYFYFLEELEKDWIETTRPEVSYNSLPSGKYVFRVKAVNASGFEIKDQIRLPIVIRPPFWETWLFKILIFSSVISLFALFYKRRIQRIKAKADILQKMAVLEGKAIRAQMNPHFIFNSLNAIQECIVTQKIDIAYDYLSRFSKLLRMVLDNSDLNFVPLNNEIETIQLYLSLEALRFNQSFTYTVTIGEELDADDIYVPSLLLQPFVENAIWHGLSNKTGEKILLIDFTEADGKLSCKVVDNGVGRIRAGEIKAQKLGAARFESKATKLAMQRIKIINQQRPGAASFEIIDLYDDNSNACGTKVIITLDSDILLLQN